MNNLPLFIPVIFGLTTLLAAFLFYKAAGYSKTTLAILLSWMALQSIPALSGFYTVTDGLPPRFILLVAPPILCILVLFISSKGRKYLDALDGKRLTLLHTVRIPVEGVLYGLYLYKSVPVCMTFEGRNFDFLSGLTAPLVYYYGYAREKMGRRLILAWNIACLALLVNIVVTAVLTAPFPFQQLSFNQPNVAVLYFPYVWLPCCVVPLVLLSHLSNIRQLLKLGWRKHQLQNLS